jgi:hypothetical protein
MKSSGACATASMGLGLLLTFGAIEAFAAADEPPCLSLQEVHGGYPRYRIIDGRRCWYASTRGPEAKPESKPEPKPEFKPEPKPESKPAEVDVNPYDDPIWREGETSKASAAADRAKICEEQALKLDVKEKRAFMKQCMSN